MNTKKRKISIKLQQEIKSVKQPLIKKKLPSEYEQYLIDLREMNI